MEGEEWEYKPTFITPHTLIFFVGLPGIIAVAEARVRYLKDPSIGSPIFDFFCHSSLLIFGVFCVLKCVVFLMLTKYQLDEVKRCKTNLFIGFGGIFVSSAVPRIMCLIVDVKENEFSFFLPLILMVFFYIFFIYNAEKPVDCMPWEASTKLMVRSSIAHFIILVVLVRIGLVLGVPQHPMMMTQLGYCVPCLTSFMEFLIIAINGLKMLTPEEQERDGQWALWPVTPRKDHMGPSMSEISLYGSTFLAVTLAPTSLFVMVFVPVSVKIWLTFGLTLVLCILSFGAIEWMKSAFERRYEVGTELEKVERDLLIGNGACAFFGLVARIGMFLFGNNVEIICSFLFICLFSSIISQYTFSYSSRKITNLDHINSPGLIFVIITLNFIGLVFGCITGFLCERRDIRIISQIAFFFLSFSSVIDFFVVIRGGAYLKRKNTVEEVAAPVIVPEEQLIPVQPDPIPLKPLPRILCKICYQIYSDTKIPRILKECGHTFCESCIDAELKKSGKRYMACTSCEAVTLIEGSASTLRKNFAMLNILEKEKE